MKKWFACASIAFSLSWMFPGLAQTPNADALAKYQGCDSGDKGHYTRDQRLGLCRAAVESGAFQGKELAMLHLDEWMILNAKNEEKLALAEVESALAAWRDIATDIAEYAGSYMARKKYDLAKAALDLAAKAQPENWHVRYRLAQWHLHRGEYDLAASENDSAMTAPLADSNVLQQRITILALRGDVAGAISGADNLVAKFPGSEIYYNFRCFLRGVLGIDLDKALADCNAALKIKPHSADVLDSRGLVYLRMGRYQESIADYDAAINLSEHPSPTSFYGRGLAEQQSGNAMSANADFQAAETLSPGIGKRFNSVALLVE